MQKFRNFFLYLQLKKYTNQVLVQEIVASGFATVECENFWTHKKRWQTRRGRGRAKLYILQENALPKFTGCTFASKFSSLAFDI